MPFGKKHKNPHHDISMPRCPRASPKTPKGRVRRISESFVAAPAASKAGCFAWIRSVCAGGGRKKRVYSDQTSVSRREFD